MSRPLAHRPAAVVTVLVILAVAVFSLGSARLTGAVIPQNDSWSFMKSALILHRTGEIRLQGWGQMFMIGQLFTAQPFLVVFGARIASLLLYGATMAAIWMWCSFLLARRCLGPWRAAALIAVIALWPGLGLLAGSFMTDLPAWAMSVLALVCGVRAVERESRVWFGLAVVVGVLAFTIREQAIAGLGAVVIAVLVRRGPSRRFRLEVVVATVVAAVLCLVLEHLRQRLPDADTPPFGLSSLSLTQLHPTLIRSPFTLGLDLSPLALWALASLRGRADWLAPGRLLGWLTGLVAVAHLAHWQLARPRVVLGNYLKPNGAYAVADVGHGPLVIADPLWRVTVLIACVSGVVLLGELGCRLASVRRDVETLRSGRPAVTALTAYTLLLALGTFGLSFAGQGQIDRYLVCFLPGLGAMLLAGPARTVRFRGRRASRVGGAALVAGTVVLAALLGTLSAYTTVATDRREGAVWRAASRLTHSGVAATDINAGLDWNGFHSATPAVREASSGKASTYQQRWISLFPETTECWAVSVGPVRRSWLHRTRVIPGGTGMATPAVYVYRSSRCR